MYMLSTDPSNTIFSKAVAFVNQTNRHLFLTGKAGTGKTTFLKFIKENTTKKIAVVAPTGVAAINAGGVTIHSFFQLPMAAFIPGYAPAGNYNTRFTDKHALLKNMRLRSEKRELLRELDLLIIDEISMVRADMLDMIDTVLRSFRKQPSLPFGGVQMLYIGDLFQLPPVIKNEDWDVLRQHYKSPFFFDAHVLQQAQPVYIELKKIYRQSDPTFINILNNIRNNCCEEWDLQHLHEYYKPGYSPSEEENYITLTSHNAKADAINETELQKLPVKSYSFEATIKGDFGDKSFPADKTLLLKEGAQVMFIKNDKGESRKYYNGKIGTIKKINAGKIVVTFPGEEAELELEEEKWENIRYNYDQKNDKIEEEELGTFTQYPIRLAWAITIHKSQGLTFEKAIIDAGSSFAPGQVYVALSRLTYLKGLILYSRIQPNCISTDPRVLEFVKNEMSEDALQQTLELEQKFYIRHTLLQSFSWAKLSEVIAAHYEAYEDRVIPGKNACIEWGKKLFNVVQQQEAVANKFIRQVEFLFQTCEADGYKQLYLRTEAATLYFIKETDEQLLNEVKHHLDEVKNKPKVKRYVADLIALKVFIERKKQQLQQALSIASALYKSFNLEELLLLVQEQKKTTIVTENSVETTEKRSKGDTQRISLQLFKEGKTIPEIAAERNLAQSTIESHLVNFITTGEIDIHTLITESKLQKIVQSINEDPNDSSAALKEKLGDGFTYAEIKAARKYIEITSPYVPKQA